MSKGKNPWAKIQNQVAQLKEINYQLHQSSDCQRQRANFLSERLNQTIFDYELELEILKTNSKLELDALTGLLGNIKTKLEEEISEKARYRKDLNTLRSVKG